ncbi:MAG: 5-(carboxyamino)imidazole ribonucleotide synthase [Alphaproteobacteria bacterium]|nr:5-(carboxyamino)imidazole ribonucleotide synthase [Alphaproteobacteria bacterium]
MLTPGASIGILGGGQLGRMTAMAATRLGYRIHVYATEADSPAAQVAAEATVGGYGDGAKLDAFAESVDVATFEFENIPANAVRRVASLTPVLPRPEILEISQHRLNEKNFLRSIGVATTDFQDVADVAALARAVGSLKRRAVLKSVRMGYDGKGQVAIDPGTDAAQAWAAMGASHGILEAFVDFRCEVSVIVARSADGDTVFYPPVENRHVNHILDTTVAPARLSPETARAAEAIAREIATRLDLVGVLAVEMFVTRSGDILVNELAPRPHNSGHWTIDACATSQFEQLVRAICGLPLGSTERHSDAVMKNLIGEDVRLWPQALADPTARLHLYGKRTIRPGRKMGHVTRLLPRRI